MIQCTDSENLHRRLKKIIGQIQAIDRMVDEDIPCEDILAQINAAKSALHKAGQVVLEGHIRHCVREGIEKGDVDKKPESHAYPNFQVPAKIRDNEIDAMLRLSFCVDASGRVYDIKVIEESPAGSGLAQAGREALGRMKFEPAEKGGKAVPFCGMEQPFEVKFRD